MSEEWNQRLSNTPASQQFVCISFLKDVEKKQSLTGIRIGGVFSTQEEAQAHADAIVKIDEYHHVYVGEVGRWLPFDPKKSQVEDEVYQDETLQKIMQGYKENRENAKIFHEYEKTDKMVKNIEENLKQRNKNREELQKKLSKVKTMDEAELITTQLDDIEKQLERMNTRLQETTENRDKLKETLDTSKASSEANPSNEQLSKFTTNEQ